MNRCSVLLGALLLTSCSQTPPLSQDPPPRGPLLQALGEEVFLPNYLDFEKTTGKLEQSARALCAAPSAKAQGVARAAWSDARAPWKRNEFLAFGPATDAPLRIGPKVDTWPARTVDIEETLAATEPLDAPSVANLGSTRRGMPVIEYLLFVGEGSPETLFAPSSRRCDYLRGLSADLAAQATLMRKAWDPEVGNYIAQLAEAGSGQADGDFASVDLALEEVVNRLVFLTENIRGSKLGQPLGNRTGGDPLPDSAESRFSGRSLEDISNNLDGIESVLFGSGAKGAASLAGYLQDSGEGQLSEPLRAALAKSRSALLRVDEPLVTSVLEDRDDIEAAIAALGELQTLLQVDVISALDLTLTFNDADGD